MKRRSFYLAGAGLLLVLAGALSVSSCDIVPTTPLSHDNPADPSYVDPDPAPCTVTFESNGGTAVASQVVEAGGLVTKPADPTKHGANFAGWYADAELTNAWDFLTGTVSSDRTLYAKWTNKPVYSISFDSVGGSTVSDQTVIEGEKAVKPADPTLTGYALDGWYREDTYETPWDFDVDTVTATIILYAKWAAKSYTVTFDKQDGTGGTDSVTVTYDSPMPAATSPNSPIDGYAFAGYYTEAGRSGTCYYTASMASALDWNIDADTTLYAAWVLDPGAQKTFVASGVTFRMNMVPGSISFFTGNKDLGTAVVASNYWIAETEVTYELWSAVRTWATSHSYTFAGTGVQGDGTGDTPEHPVTTVSWRDAMIWCNALTEWYNAQNGTSFACVYYYFDGAYTTPIRESSSSGTVETTAGTYDKPYIKAAASGNTDMANCTADGFRLPTAAEWELAARFIADTNEDGDVMDAGEYYFGDHVSGDTTGYCYNYGLGRESLSVIFGNYAWYWENTGDSTHVVGTAGNGGGAALSGNANALGIFDLSGGVHEWNFDWGTVGSYRVRRGGTWGNAADSLPIGSYTASPPNYGDWTTGFRFARNAN